MLIFTGWYPTPEKPLDFPFVSQQVKMMKEALPRLSGEIWEIVVWHQGLPIDFPNRILRNKKPRNFDWTDNGILVKFRQSTILSHRLPGNQSFFYKKNMRETYRQVENALGGPPDGVWTITLSSAILWNWFQTKQRINIPYFLQEHSVPLSTHLKNFYKRRAAIRLAENIKKVVVVSERQIEEFDMLSKVFNCEIIWNAVDSVFLTSTNKIPIKKSLVFVGRLSYQKAVLRLLRAFAIAIKKELEITLTIIGTGELEDEHKTLANELKLGDAINFIGSKTSSEIAHLLEEFEAFVLPSFYENCPVSLLEAQVKGVPCLVTKNGASEKVLLPGNGLVVDDDGSGEQLAIGITDLLNKINDYDRIKIRQSAIAAFSPQVFTEKMYNVLKEVMS